MQRFFVRATVLATWHTKGKYCRLYNENKSERSGTIFLNAESWCGIHLTQGPHSAWTIPLGRRNQMDFIRDAQNPIYIYPVDFSYPCKFRSLYTPCFCLFLFFEITWGRGWNLIRCPPINREDIGDKTEIDSVLCFYTSDNSLFFLSLPYCI